MEICARYIAYQDIFGPANASQLDQLILQKREEQKFNSMVEKQLKNEQARFAQAQELRRNAEAQEAELRETLQRLQRELYEEQASIENGIEQLRYLREQGKRPKGFFGNIQWNIYGEERVLFKGAKKRGGGEFISKQSFERGRRWDRSERVRATQAQEGGEELFYIILYMSCMISHAVMKPFEDFRFHFST